MSESEGLCKRLFDGGDITLGAEALPRGIEGELRYLKIPGGLTGRCEGGNASVV